MAERASMVVEMMCSGEEVRVRGRCGGWCVSIYKLDGADQTDALRQRISRCRRPRVFEHADASAC